MLSDIRMYFRKRDTLIKKIEALVRANSELVAKVQLADQKRILAEQKYEGAMEVIARYGDIRMMVLTQHGEQGEEASRT